MTPPQLATLFTAQIELGPPVELGRDSKGTRRVVPILGGTFTGARVSGELLPGGADWQLIREDGVVEVEARYPLRTADGALITAISSGFRHGPAEVLAAIAAGETVDPALYYFRTRLTFEPGRADYAWLGRLIGLATAARRLSSVELHAYEVL